MKENSPIVCHQEKGSLWHSYCGQWDAPKQSLLGHKHRPTRTDGEDQWEH